VSTPSFSIDTKAGAFDAFINSLEEQVDAAVRPAAQAGAEVLYRSALRRLKGRKTGNLERAVYQAFEDQKSGKLRALYRISWNPRKAPHGHLVEFGHIQRYVVYMGKDGNFYTAVRPSMRNKKKPSRKASQAVKDAYYIPLKSPKQIAAVGFIRGAASELPAALEAMKRRLFEGVQ
jgi:hypothetical protein